MAEHALFTLIPSGALLAGLIVSVSGAIVSASHAYAVDRKKEPPLLDYIDLILLVITSTFSGFIGFLLASFWLQGSDLILAVSGLSAVAGYSVLLSVKDIFIDVLRSKLVPSSIASSKGKRAE